MGKASSSVRRGQFPVFEGVFGVPHSLESEKVEAMVKKNPRKITIENFINNENQHVVASEDCSVRSIRFPVDRGKAGLRPGGFIKV